MDILLGSWGNQNSSNGTKYLCGHCGNNTAPSYRYPCTREEIADRRPRRVLKAAVYICAYCNKPTYLETKTSHQVPGIIYGDEIEYLPKEIQSLYDEARKCVSVNAFTSAVLACRKLLMNISVTKGASPGESFVFYVNYLEQNHYTPPGSREGVDHIRKKGNEATHDIPAISKEDALELIDFTEMILRFIYEMPGRMQAKYQPQQTE